MVRVFRWDNRKNQWLKEWRGVSFEQVVFVLERGEALDILEHPNRKKYPNQKIALINIEGYAYLVPYVQEGDEIFLKTVIPSRKATAKYLGGKL